jgi:chromosome segregation ATPase
MPKQDPILIEKVNKLTEEITDFEIKIKANEIELRSRGEKLDQLTKELSDLKTKNGINIKDLENYRSNISTLKQSLENLEKEKKNLNESHEKLVKSFEILTDSYKKISDTYKTIESDLIKTKEGVIKKESKITVLDEKVESLNDKLFALSQDKEMILKEKNELIETSLNEKMKLTNKITEFNFKIEEYNGIVKNLKKKVKSRGDGLLGHSMEIEMLKKKIDEKDRKLEKVEGFLSGETGIFTEFDTLKEYLSTTLQKVKRSVRIVLPNMLFFEKFELMPKFNELSDKIILNIAVPILNKEDETLLSKLKERDTFIINTTEKDIFALSIDGTNLALGVVSSTGEDVRGIYTTIPELINLLNVAIMNPFVKGKKI